MKTGYQWVFWLALAVSVITSATLVLVLADLSLFKEFPVLYLASLTAITGGLIIMIRKDLIPFLSWRLRLQGKMLVTPLTLLLFSGPAALAYIYFDLTGKELFELVMVLLASLSAVFFFVTLFIFAMPGYSVISQFYPGKKPGLLINSELALMTSVAAVLVSIPAIVINELSGGESTGFLVALPLLALILVILNIILAAKFRNKVREGINTPADSIGATASDRSGKMSSGGLQSLILFHRDYLDLISGRLDFLSTGGDDSYASVIVRSAESTFDPALVPALTVIINGMRFSESVRRKAATALSDIETFYSDPVRNRGMLRRPGISESAASARAILVNKRVPQLSEVLKLLNDENPGIKKAGLAAAGRFGLIQLREEILQALAVPEISREAYYLLVHFGPDIYGDIIGSAVKPQGNEQVSMMVIRLLSLMQPGKALPHLTQLMLNAPVRVKTEAAGYLAAPGFDQDEMHLRKSADLVSRTVYNLARLIAFRIVAEEKQFLMLAKALQWERKTYERLLYALISLLYGSTCAEMIAANADAGTASGSEIAAELIDTAIAGTLRKQLTALLGHHTDAVRLRELSYCFPLREVTRKTLTHSILAADQNITGVWSKACALHKIAEEGHGTEREVVLSYLFSGSQLLQEEAARVIRSLNHSWFSEVEERLPEPVRQKAAALINGQLPDMAAIFEKVRFLSLCFKSIPEERIIDLAAGMSYTESYYGAPSKGLLNWIIPSDTGKTGLYSLHVDGITEFVFHYSEYTDIFVDYMEGQGKEIAP